MVPFILDGDLVVVPPGGGSESRVGDVVCYQTSPGRLFLHKPVARDVERLMTKGDALPYTEGFDPAQLLGTAVARERPGRTGRLDTWVAHRQNSVVAFLSLLISPLLPCAIRLRHCWRVAKNACGCAMVKVD